ncbi:MAG: hypothetical protein AVDCRST_MAG10-347, partial [uncultured Acidimicrobiales bacterium]
GDVAGSRPRSPEPPGRHRGVRLPAQARVRPPLRGRGAAVAGHRRRRAPGRGPAAGPHRRPGHRRADPRVQPVVADAPHPPLRPLTGPAGPRDRPRPPRPRGLRGGQQHGPQGAPRREGGGGGGRSRPARRHRRHQSGRGRRPAPCRHLRGRGRCRVDQRSGVVGRLGHAGHQAHPALRHDPGGPAVPVGVPAHPYRPGLRGRAPRRGAGQGHRPGLHPGGRRPRRPLLRRGAPADHLPLGERAQGAVAPARHRPRHRPALGRVHRPPARGTAPPAPV